MSTNWVTQAESIAHYYGKGKEEASSDGSWMTLCPVHGDSAKPNLHVTPKDNKILLHCHACGTARHSDIVKVISENFEISEKSTRQPKTLSKDDRNQWITPIPSTAPVRPMECYLGQKLGKRKPDMMWAYLSENNEALMFNARFNIVENDGSTTKIYRRLALYTTKGDNSLAWSWYGPDASLPLYGLEQLTDKWWERPVMLVEGEKAADAARKIFPDMVIIAFPGGAGNYNKVNWAPLLQGNKLEKILLWPDNDAAGQTMAHGPASLSAFLLKSQIRTKVVPVFDQEALPAKWDLADPLPDGWDKNNLVMLLDKAAYADVSDIARVHRYCATLAQIDGVADFKKLANTSCKELSKTPKSRCAQCLQFKRIEKPQDIVSTPDILLKWIYLTRHKNFYNVMTREQLDLQGFNALWAASPGYTLNGDTAAGNALLTDIKTTKVYDFGYMPSSPAIMRASDGTTRINRWGGFKIHPDTSGDPPTPWLDLIDYLITDEAVRAHILNWLAVLVQKPEIKVNHGLLLVSPVQGVGKDSLIQPIREILGNNYRDISSRALDSEFSEYLMDTKLLVISELDTIGHRKSTYDAMKPLLAAPPTTLGVNIKNMKQVEIDNVVQVIAFSNKDVPVAIEDSDRRWLVYKIKHSKGDLWPADKFVAYYDWLKNGGSAKVFGWLLTRDISKFNAGLPAPATSDKVEMSRSSDSELVKFHEAIDAHTFPFHVDLVSFVGLQEALLSRLRIRIDVRGMERYCLNYNAQILPHRITINGKRTKIFICRHADFWSKQSPEALTKAFKGNYVDMGAGKGSDYQEPMANDFQF